MIRLYWLVLFHVCDLYAELWWRLYLRESGTGPARTKYLQYKRASLLAHRMRLRYIRARA